ncbi:MAG: RNA polymerase factor sigma-54 [Rikenellaceae bacterium]|jgi:RNA polymerase sigma-54 factor|nr:RNA polymerase factor sigma-54 [Rikenellaceae bacterium]
MATLSQRSLQKMMQKLSPQQIQMIKLLELPALQLEQRIKQEIEENPVIEEEIEVKQEEGEEEKKDFSIDEYIQDDVPAYKSYVNNYSKEDSISRPLYIADRLTFHEYLTEQLGYKTLDDRARALAEYLIGSLDDDGYLRRKLEFLADDIAFSTGLETDEQELEKVLRVIQELEPVGVGARDLQECLLLQIRAINDPSPAQELAKIILTDYFEEFTKKHYEKMKNRLGVSLDDFREAIEEITGLTPRPGNMYAGGAAAVTPTITPDFILDYQDGKFDVQLSYANVPEMKISRHYLEMVKDLSAKKEHQSESEKETVQFVKHKIESAKWFISAIKQRHNTLMQTMQAILDYQKDYFVEGDQTKLRPMILKDIADRTGLDVSTISRVVNSKYILTHFGVFSLKTLFSEAMQTESGEEVSSHEIKQILTDCIENEDKHKPLTDETLMEILNDKGYRIARRTVAKYREMLGIPVARLRKEL